MDTVLVVIEKLLPFVLFLGFMFLLLKFVLQRSHSGMDKSIEMQEAAMKGQVDAIQMANDGLELQRKTLAEMQEIRKLLEKK